MDYLIAALLIYYIVGQHALHYKNSLVEKLIKDYWVALEALKIHVVNNEVVSSSNGRMSDSFLEAMERFDQRLAALEPKEWDNE